jgi:class 3 adenylate cyclase
MPASVAGSVTTGSSDNSLDFELAFQNADEDEVDESELNVFQRCWRAINIPFELQVVSLMTIPIICLVVFSSLIFVDTFNRRNYIGNHADLISQIFDCATSLADERQLSNDWIVQSRLDPNSAATANASAQMMAARAQAQADCTQVADFAYLSADNQIKNDYSDTVRETMQEHSILRFRLDNRRVGSTEFREKITNTIISIESGLAVLAQSKTLKFESLTLLQLREFRMVENILSRAQIVGIAWLTATANNSTYLELELELQSVISSLNQYITSSLNIVTGFAAFQFYAWYGFPQTNVVLQELPLILNGQSTMDVATWTSVVRLVTAEIRKLAPTVMRDLIEAKQLQNNLRDEAIKLSVALVTSILAAGYIIRAQILSSRQISEEVQESKKLHKAVTKFVPKSFLKLMGCTSVTHIVAGDQTEVSVAMVFADIHDFNAMTNNMSGEHLFDWLEVYFEQMSTITDNGRGFVDKFIGDAMFCVFMNATEAVESSILMQAMTDQLNGEIVCSGGTQLIRIGIGIHHAVVSAGILGDSRRHTCTLVSSDVNLASRLEGLTKFYGARIIVSASTVELCDRRTLAFRRLGAVKAKGRANGVEICEVFQTDPLDLKLFKRETMEDFHKGVELQQANDIDGAKKLFASLREKAKQRNLVDMALDLKLAQQGSMDEMTKK